MVISVIICTYNREEYIGDCLLHIGNQSLNTSDFEIIIVNNRSTDNTDHICLEFIAKHPELNIKYIIESQQGLSFARNRGIEEAVGGIFSFIDDDAFASYHYLENAVKWFSTLPEMEAAGGKIIPVFEKGKPQWFTNYLLPLVAAIDMGDNLVPFPQQKFPIGANMLFRNSVFNKIGLFNTALGRKGVQLLGGEEKDMFSRLKNKTVNYLPDVEVKHIVPYKRISTEYIRKQAIGIGASERIRLQKSTLKDKILKIVSELTKGGGSLLLFLYYTLKIRPMCGLMLLKFRIWIWIGYFKG